MKGLLIKLGKVSLMIQRNGLWGGGKIVLGYLKIYFKSFFVGSGDVLFISSGVGDSAHYRAYNPAEELKRHGFKTAVTISDNPNLPRLAGKFKIFVFQRTVCNKYVDNLIRKIKEQKKEIIFDTDDLVHDPAYLKHMDYFQKMSAAEQELYKKGIGAEIFNDPYVKVCTTTVSYLADKIREKGKKVIIVPNKFSEAEWNLTEDIVKKEKLNDGLVRIVYASGTLSHNKDFETIKEALLRILEKYKRVKLFLFGPLDIPLEFLKIKSRIEISPRVSRKEYYEKLYRADINLAPLETGNPFCEAKSAIRFIGAGALKIPTVAVRNQTFSEAIEDGADGFLADKPEEWEEKLSLLVEDENLRKTMGERAREKVLKKYTNKNSDNEEYYAYIKKRLAEIK